MRTVGTVCLRACVFAQNHTHLRDTMIATFFSYAMFCLHNIQRDILYVNVCINIYIYASLKYIRKKKEMKKSTTSFKLSRYRLAQA